MKKTISVNLQGIIFHVEDDGYALLNNYLTSVKAYFSTFDGHEEIMADIESRIAEIFLTRQNPGKQIVTLEDVQYLIARMGSVADFAAQAEDEDAAYHQAYSNNTGSKTNTGRTTGGNFNQDPFTDGPRRLYRDENRKMLAGVAAGMGNYFKIDPLWIRLILVLLVIGSPITAGGTAGIAIIGYIILWMVLPVSYTLPEVGVKKLYRDPEDKKLAGVSSGIAHYFGADPMWIRLLFLVLLFLFGTGVVAYIVLWIIMPEAKTNSEKAEMRGNPVTLSSIEDSIRNNNAFKDAQGQESTIGKILLFPVRVLSQILHTAGPALKAIILFLLTFIRIGAGIVLTLTGLAMIAGAIAMLTASFGTGMSGALLDTDAHAIAMVIQELPWYGLIAGFLVIFIPSLLLTIIGLSLIAKRSLMRQSIGWTMFGLFVAAIIVAATAGAFFANKFKQSGTVTENITFQKPLNSPLQLVLSPDEANVYEDYDLLIGPGKDSSAIVVLAEYQSQGANRQDAIRAAKMLNLPVSQTDSALVFTPTLSFKPGAVYRAQDMELRMQIPVGQPFVFHEDLAEMISFTEEGDGIYPRDFAGKTMVFEAGKLRCLSCTADDSTKLGRISDKDIPEGAQTEKFDFSGFSHVEAGGNIKVVITKALHYNVQAYGNKNGLSRLDIKDENGHLKIETDGNIWNMSGDDQLTVHVSMPDLQSVAFAGSVKAKVIGFETHKFEATIVGASEVEMDITCAEMKTEIIGASTLTITGKAEHLDADVVGASGLEAYGLLTKTADVQAAGASHAKVQVTDRLDAEANGASSIRYSGNPENVEQNASGAASIESNSGRKAGE